MAATSLSHLSDLISVEEYLNTTYRPDVDYVDGHIEERNWGVFDHGDLQLEIGTFFRIHQHEWSIRVVVETRMQTTPTRFRIPDVCILPLDRERERIIRLAPLLCVEVLSPRDRLKAMRVRVQEYLDLGVREVWSFDPAKRTAYVCAGEGMTEHKEGLLQLAGTPIELSIPAVFATLDR